MRTGATLIIYLLAGIMLFNNVFTSLTYAYYYLDPVGFIEQLCDNKDKPELQCNGKCHLSMISSAETSDEQTPIIEIRFEQLLLFIERPQSYELRCIPINNQNLNTYNSLYKFELVQTFLHPPEVS